MARSPTVVFGPIPQRGAIPVVVDDDGALVRYDPHYFSQKEADRLFYQIQNECFKDTEKAKGQIAGKPFEVERRTLHLGDPGTRTYKFTGSTAKKPHLFKDYPAVDALKTKISEEMGVAYNYCLVNMYSPDASLGYHSDSEREMVPGSVITSLSFGDPRRFRIKRNSDGVIIWDTYLSSGSLLTMEGLTQDKTKHCIWKSLVSDLPTFEYGLRINLTFRLMQTVA